MSARNLAALVLAAGASTRLGQAKQMLRYRGELLVQRAVRIAREAGADPVFVVLGANYAPIFQVLSAMQPQVRVLLNQAWAQGMGQSIALGAAAAERDGADDLLVLTCDQIHVTADHLRRLVEISRRDHVVASAYAGRRGVPALFQSSAFMRCRRCGATRVLATFCIRKMFLRSSCRAEKSTSTHRRTSTTWNAENSRLAPFLGSYAQNHDWS